jgi:hypothetical protein
MRLLIVAVMALAACLSVPGCERPVPPTVGNTGWRVEHVDPPFSFGLTRVSVLVTRDGERFLFISSPVGIAVAPMERERVEVSR